MRKVWLLLISFFGAASICAALPRAITAPLRNPDNGHEYYLLDSANWIDSEAAAKLWGGHLATIRSQAEQDWIFSTYAGDSGGAQRLLWIGLNDVDELLDFKWVSGEPVTFLNWANGEPNNAGGDERFVALYYPDFNQPGAWNDWNNRTADPIGLPINGVAEFIPQLSIEWTATGDLELSFPRALSDYYIEATADLATPFATLNYDSHVIDPQRGVYVAVISPTEPKMFFRLRKRAV